MAAVHIILRTFMVCPRRDFPYKPLSILYYWILAAHECISPSIFSLGTVDETKKSTKAYESYDMTHTPNNIIGHVLSTRKCKMFKIERIIIYNFSINWKRTFWICWVLFCRRELFHEIECALNMQWACEFWPLTFFSFRFIYTDGQAWTC